MLSKKGVCLRVSIFEDHRMLKYPSNIFFLRTLHNAKLVNKT